MASASHWRAVGKRVPWFLMDAWLIKVRFPFDL